MLLQSSNKLVQEYPEFLSDSPGVVVIGQMRIWHVHIFTSVERTENISVISTHKQEVQLTPVPYLRRPHGEGRGVTKTKTTIIIIITIILWSGAERVVILIRESDIEGIMLPFKPALCLHRNMSVSPEGRLKADGSDESFHYLQWVLSAARPRRCLFFTGKRSLVHTQWSHCDVISSQCLWETSLNIWVTCRCELRCFYVNR